MKVISEKEFCKLIESKDWILKRVNGSHHIYAKSELTRKSTRTKDIRLFASPHFGLLFRRQHSEKLMKKATKKEDLISEDNDFNYQPELTKLIDEYDDDFSQATINEITLWKVNRYPIVNKEVLNSLNKIKKSDEKYDLEELKLLVKKLLECHGVQMPMASTYLRFKNPSLFQIIDQRVYRILYGEKMKLPSSYNEKNRNKIVDIYFKYLSDLKKLCTTLEIDFEQSDRILYNTDKRINKKIKLSNY
ncbi:type II toxin-antitoxin system HicA family toxin [Candidatus Thioglobus sp.]|uniref:type II toxin-antitoxin system HicA family toxin n=1 Tax=Candidatus Thioglobus sp. TaxID=2026721 RepID=UPI003D0A50D1